MPSYRAFSSSMADRPEQIPLYPCPSRSVRRPECSPAGTKFDLASHGPLIIAQDEERNGWPCCSQSTSSFQSQPRAFSSLPENQKFLLWSLSASGHSCALRWPCSSFEGWCQKSKRFLHATVALIFCITPSDVFRNPSKSLVELLRSHADQFRGRHKHPVPVVGSSRVVRSTPVISARTTPSPFCTPKGSLTAPKHALGTALLRRKRKFVFAATREHSILLLPPY